MNLINLVPFIIVITPIFYFLYRKFKSGKFIKLALVIGVVAYLLGVFSILLSNSILVLVGSFLAVFAFWFAVFGMDKFKGVEIELITFIASFSILQTIGYIFEIKEVQYVILENGKAGGIAFASVLIPVFIILCLRFIRGRLLKKH